MGDQLASRVAGMVSALNTVADRDISSACNLLNRTGKIPKIAGCFEAMLEREIISESGFPTYRASAILALDQVNRERLGVVEGNDTEPESKRTSSYTESVIKSRASSYLTGGSRSAFLALRSPRQDSPPDSVDPLWNTLDVDREKWQAVDIDNPEVAFKLEEIGVHPDHRSFPLIWEGLLTYSQALSREELCVEDLKATDFFYAEPGPILPHKIDCMCVRCLG